MFSLTLGHEYRGVLVLAYLFRAPVTVFLDHSRFTQEALHNPCNGLARFRRPCS